MNWDINYWQDFRFSSSEKCRKPILLFVQEILKWVRYARYPTVVHFVSCRGHFSQEVYLQQYRIIPKPNYPVLKLFYSKHNTICYPCRTCTGPSPLISGHFSLVDSEHHFVPLVPRAGRPEHPGKAPRCVMRWNFIRWKACPFPFHKSAPNSSRCAFSILQ